MKLGKSDINAAISNSRTQLFAMSGFVVLIVLLAAYFAAGRLTKPLGRLRAALDELASGSSSFRLSHSRADEYGLVYDAFNRLAAAVDVPAGATAKADPRLMDMTRIESVDSHATPRSTEGAA